MGMICKARGTLASQVAKLLIWPGGEYASFFTWIAYICEVCTFLYILINVKFFCLIVKRNNLVQFGYAGFGVLWPFTAKYRHVNALWLSDAIWWHWSGSTLVQVMACGPRALSHYLNQCWLYIACVLCYSPNSNVTCMEVILKKLLPYFPWDNEVNQYAGHTNAGAPSGLFQTSVELQLITRVAI